MGIELKLNAEAVRALVSDDDDFRLELQRCVVAEIVRKTFRGDVEAKSRELIVSEVGKATDNLHLRTAEILRSETAILEVIKSRMDTDFKQAIARGQQDARGFVGPSLKAAVETRLSAIVARVIDENLDVIKEMIRPKIEQRFETVLSGLESAWKAEMERQIRADVMTRLQGAMR